MFAGFNWQQMVSAFIVLFAVIDIIGSIPIIINLKEKGKDVNAMKATVISFVLLIGFFYAGDMMLKLFHVDIESFAVAGAFVIFLMSLEMILDIENAGNPLYFFFSLFLLHPGNFQSKGEILFDAHVWIKSIILKHHADSSVLRR